MATIKSYTDLSQSKKLADILPLESADMKWFFWMEESDASRPPSFGYSKTAAECYKDTEVVYLPCWSLAALLDILPNPNLFEADGLWHIFCDNNLSCINGFDNPVDACVAMIEKLNELNLL